MLTWLLAMEGVGRVFRPLQRNGPAAPASARAHGPEFMGLETCPAYPTPACRSSPPSHGTAHIDIVIGSTIYTLMPHYGTVPAWDLVVRQGREPGARYTALVNAHGHPACTCPDHQNRGTRCKHLGALIAAGLLS